MAIIRWEDPPVEPRAENGKTQKVSGRWQMIALELAERPMKWALVAEDVSFGSLANLRRHGCEITTRELARDGRAGKGYARYVGGAR